MQFLVICVNQLNSSVNMFLRVAKEDKVDHKQQSMEDQVEAEYENRAGADTTAALHQSTEKYERHGCHMLH